ncbi:MAG: hypothetical protein F6K50_05680 [Moorea sp. SIO3I7]|nr:hypothetical protein [Moorena sp. SIO3I7]
MEDVSVLLMDDEVQKLQLELQRMSANSTLDLLDSNRVVFRGDNLVRTKQIGTRLYELGGHSLMVSVCESLVYLDQLRLEQAWHGVGIWRA